MSYGFVVLSCLRTCVCMCVCRRHDCVCGCDIIPSPPTNHPTTSNIYSGAEEGGGWRGTHGRAPGKLWGSVSHLLPRRDHHEQRGLAPHLGLSSLLVVSSLQFPLSLSLSLPLPLSLSLSPSPSFFLSLSFDISFHHCHSQM